MKNITKESQDLLNSLSTEILRVWDAGMDNHCHVKLKNGMIGKGIYPAWKPLKLIESTFK
jgi:hypothetical protein